MTRVAYLDLVGGVAGDMLLAALLDAGAVQGEVFEWLGQLPLAHRQPCLEPVLRGGIRAQLLVGTPSTAGTTRSLDEIGQILDAAKLPEQVSATARRVFERLAAAEARAHGQPLEKVRLHEAGDDDAIFDVVGVLLALDSLAVTDVVSSSVPLGGGRAERLAGSWPGPATAELLRGVPVIGPPPHGEATTPTGAALVTTVASGYGPLPSMTLEAVGYGAGARDPDGVPNLVRVFVGERTEPAWHSQRDLVVIEANLDDLSPQLVADAFGALLAAGALDVWTTPIQMKHARMAVTLSALVDGGDRVAIQEVFFRTTTTLGVRAYVVERAVLERDTVDVQVRGHAVRVKRGRLGDETVTATPEHRDVVEVSGLLGIPVRRLWDEASAAAHLSSDDPWRRPADGERRAGR
jgi:pyridinium-3,5-bisthiocarboxylic acid mononucleotide nickel chelatase